MPGSPEIALFQMRVYANSERLDELVRVIQKRGFSAERIFRSVPHEAVERRNALLVPDFLRTIEANLPKVMLVGADPFFQMRREAGFDVVQQRTRNHELFILESLMQDLVDVLELWAHLLINVRLGHLAEKVLVEVDQQFLGALTHIRRLAMPRAACNAPKSAVFN